MTQHTLKMSDGLFITAEAIVKLAQQSGIKTNINTIYTKENLEGIALIAGLMRQIVEKSDNVKIEILNQ